MPTAEIAHLIDSSIVRNRRRTTDVASNGVPSTTMTFLFTDIEGSTRQWEESPEMHDRVEQHFGVLREAVDAVGGEVFATMGDGIAAAFPSAEAAVQAAISAQRRMPPIGLRVRMGIHSGEVERVGDDFRGRPVNRAARIMAVGHGGQILVSDVSAALVRTGPSPVEFADLGPHRLRDLTEPERMWQVVHPDLEQQFPPVRGLDTYSNNLPPQRSSLIGRDRDVARVIELVARHRIVTLTGVGGVGKTRLGVQAAADLLTEFSNVWFAELASVADPDDVADAIALTLGVGAVNDPLAAAAAMLAGEGTLLVVDNCEHVVDSVAAVIDALTAQCPGLSVIATSREALGVEGEHVIAVGSLDPSTTAVELFHQRAVAAGADIESMERSLVEQICRRLDGIPLAIELAAARAGDARDAGDRERPRRPVQPAERGSPSSGRSPRHDARHDRLVVPPSRARRAARVPVAGSVLERVRARRRPAHRRHHGNRRGRGNRAHRVARAQEHDRSRVARPWSATPDARDDAGVRPRATRSGW